MIKKTVVCDKCQEAEAKYYTGERMNVVYCEKCIMDVLGARRADSIRCHYCGRGVQDKGIVMRHERHYCSVECLIKEFYGTSSAGELNDTQKKVLIGDSSDEMANG